MLTRSVIEKFLNTELSQLAIPGAFSCESFLGSLPKVNCAGWVKHDVLNHWFNLPTAPPEVCLEQPCVTWGL